MCLSVSVYVPVCISVCLSVCPSAYLYMDGCLTLCLSFSLLGTETQPWPQKLDTTVNIHIDKHYGLLHFEINYECKKIIIQALDRRILVSQEKPNIKTFCFQLGA
jgi:hypothetical protein